MISSENVRRELFKNDVGNKFDLYEHCDSVEAFDFILNTLHRNFTVNQPGGR